MSTADILADCKSAGKLVSMATNCDKPIIYSLTAQHDPGPYYSSDVLDTWWALARQKHQIMLVRFWLDLLDFWAEVPMHVTVSSILVRMSNVGNNQNICCCIRNACYHTAVCVCCVQ